MYGTPPGIPGVFRRISQIVPKKNGPCVGVLTPSTDPPTLSGDIQADSNPYMDGHQT